MDKDPGLQMLKETLKRVKRMTVDEYNELFDKVKTMKPLVEEIRPIKKTKKVVFLDFDGVIVNRTTRYKYPSLRPMRHLQDIVDKTGAEVVITSVWRKSRTLKELRNILNSSGFCIPVIDVTPYLSGKDRGDEITKWLNENEGVESYIILDDDRDMTIHMSRLICTNCHRGLRKADKIRAIQLLGKREKKETSVVLREIDKLNAENAVTFLNQFECNYHDLTDVEHRMVVMRDSTEVLRKRYNVQCSCGATGPFRNTVSEAVRVWLFKEKENW